MTKRKAESPVTPAAQRTMDAAQAEHEAERMAYLAQLDPRQREMLDPPGPE